LDATSANIRRFQDGSDEEKERLQKVKGQYGYLWQGRNSDSTLTGTDPGNNSRNQDQFEISLKSSFQCFYDKGPLYDCYETFRRGRESLDAADGRLLHERSLETP